MRKQKSCGFQELISLDDIDKARRARRRVRIGSRYQFMGFALLDLRLKNVMRCSARMTGAGRKRSSGFLTFGSLDPWPINSLFEDCHILADRNVGAAVSAERSLYGVASLGLRMEN
jgi:hypothetical protein